MFNLMLSGSTIVKPIRPQVNIMVQPCLPQLFSCSFIFLAHIILPLIRGQHMCLAIGCTGLLISKKDEDKNNTQTDSKTAKKRIGVNL